MAQPKMSAEAAARRDAGIRLAMHAPRQRASCAPLPDVVAAYIRHLRAQEPPGGSTRHDLRAALDHYLYRLYTDGGWPAGALMEPLGLKSRENLHHRLRRVRDGVAPPAPAEIDRLPVPKRPVGVRTSQRCPACGQRRTAPTHPEDCT